MFRITLLLLITSFYLFSYSQDLTWKWLGPERFPTFSGDGPCASGMGLVNALYVNPIDPSFILAGSNTGGLFRTRNGGLTWENVSDKDLPLVAGIGSVVADPFFPGRFYLGTGTTSFNRNYGLGIWQSDDWGDTWQPTGLTFNPERMGGEQKTIRKILVHPVMPGVIFALVREGSTAMVYRSLDGGARWFEVLRSNGEVFYDAEFDPGDPETIYLGGNAFWISRDGGENWISNRMDAPEGEKIHRVAVAVHPLHPGKIWILYETGDQRGIVLSYSSNHGHTFSQRANFYPWQLDVGAWKMEFDVSRKDTSVLYAGGVFMHRSKDGGRTFQRITNNRYPAPDWMHVDARAMLMLDGMQQDILYVGHDGGVSVSRDGGDTWVDISGTGLGITQFWAFALDPIKNRIIGGTQDLGTLFWDQHAWWNAGIYGDAYDALFHPLHPDTIVLMIHSGAPGLRRSTDGGKSWRFINQPSGPQRNDRPLAQNPVFLNTLYAGYHDIIFSTDFGLSWDKLSDFSRDFGVDPHEGLISIAISASNPDVIYAAYGEPCWSDQSSKKLFRTRDHGRSWADISVNLTGVRWAGITDLAINPNNPDEIWVSLDRFWIDDRGVAYKVFVSFDGGMTWENSSEGLRNVPVNTLLYLSKQGMLVAGTDAGVYARSLKGGQWFQLGKGMPNVIVSDLEVTPNQQNLYASTFGRGLYQLDLPSYPRRDEKERKGFLRFFRRR